MSRTSRNSPLPEAAQPRVNDTAAQRAFDLLFVPLREVVRFLQPFVQSEKWKPLALLNGFRNYSNDFYPAQYRKDPMGRVWLRGLVFRSAASTSALFILPVGYRPSCRVGCTTTANNDWARFDVRPDGSFAFDGAASANWFNFVFLDGISFDTVNE